MIDALKIEPYLAHAKREVAIQMAEKIRKSLEAQGVTARIDVADDGVSVIAPMPDDTILHSAITDAGGRLV